MTRLVLFELFVTNLLLFEHQQKLLIHWRFSGTYGVTKYSSGWRKDVINQCLEFALGLGFEHIGPLGLGLGFGHKSLGLGFEHIGLLGLGLVFGHIGRLGLGLGFWDTSDR